VLGFGKKNKASADSLDQFEVPSFSAAVLNLLSKLRDPEASINELAEDLELDPGLHVRVLKMVNSAAFGLSHKVSNIRHAVNLLGRSRLESLVLSVAVKDSLSAAGSPDGFDMQAFWATAALRATVARELAAHLEPNLQADVFTIGLLQDIGIPQLARQHQAFYQELYAHWQSDPSTELIDLERLRCSSDHASLGARMARSWGFPDSLVEAIDQHHQAEGESSLPLSARIASRIRGNPELDTPSRLADWAAQHSENAAEPLTEILADAFAASDELARALQ
jgi:HD-like signal output (HDOD) protein